MNKRYQSESSSTVLAKILADETLLYIKTKNAYDHIHYYLIEQAKYILLHTNQTIGEVAYHLGFEYPQYFSKLFKHKNGQTPMEYRNSN